MRARIAVVIAGIFFLLPRPGRTTIYDVSITGFDFVPAGLVITQGDTIRWTNHDIFTHTSTSDSGVWNSGNLAQNQSYSFAFANPGAFPYHCALHLSMKDTITVNPPANFDLQIDMGDNFFSPAVAQISPGQTVRWMNMGIHMHTSTSNDGVWDSDSLAPDQHFDFMFANEGVYRYHCAIHSLAMKGTVIVGKPDSVAFDIGIVDFAFQPADTSLMIGQNVRWINMGAMPHTTTDTSVNYWDSDTLNPGDVFTLHAGQAGIFYYLCSFHPGMTGSLTVHDTISGGCDYVIGDINGNNAANGIDVVYAVGFFKGGPPPPDVCDCPGHGQIFAAGDVNGNCVFNGIDVTYFVGYLKGGPALRACADCPPASGLAPVLHPSLDQEKISRPED